MTGALGSGAWIALGLAALGAAIVAGSGQGTRTGAVAGLVVAVVSILGLGAGTLAPLAVFVLGSGALTRWGRARKEALGAAQPNEGRRDARHVAAKLGLPALLGLCGMGGVVPLEILSAAYASAVAGAFADTAATEVGPIFGGPVYGWRSGRLARLQHGEPGGVSRAGCVALALAATAVAVGAGQTGLVRGPGGIVVVALAGVMAPLAESAVANTGAGRALGHFGKNALVSVVAALLGAAGAAIGSTN